jgi:adenylosuccinate synthase
VNHIVLGAGFGDEGKGATVASMCAVTPDSLVVRFNGGHQAGHTVVKEYGVSHVFSSFGSGTLDGKSTYWSKYCTVYPIALLNEYDILVKKTCYPFTLYIDPFCPITTPFDIDVNHHIAEYTGHGTVGVGFGTTIDRCENFYNLFAMDLLNPFVLREKLKAIRNFYKGHRKLEWVNSEEQFIKAVERMIAIPDICIGLPEISRYKSLIFEGAQGILLDQNFGFFPQVTRSNTTSMNALEILRDFNLDKEPYGVHYVTRAYQTRHGNGPMSSEHHPVVLKNNELETNVKQTWQGEFRTGKLDIELLRYAIMCDKYISKPNKTRLVITCTKHVDDDKGRIPIIYEGKEYQIFPYEVPEMLSFSFDDVSIPTRA